jgi:hypothetical protein
VLMLWAAAMEKGYNCPLWLTYKGSAHESALYAPFTRTNAEFKEHFKADDIGATLRLSPTVIARGRRCGRARVLVTQGPNFRKAATSAEPLKSSAL